MSWLLWIVLLWTLGLTYLFKQFCLDIHPRVGLLNQYANSVFSFLRNVCTVLHSGCTSLHSYEQCGAGGLVTKSCLTPVTPWSAAHQAPPSLGFSRQEHWSGLPFPSPMCESEKWKWSRSVVSDSSRPHGPQPTRLLRPWDFPGKSPGVGCPTPMPYWPQAALTGEGCSLRSMTTQRFSV